MNRARSIPRLTSLDGATNEAIGRLSAAQVLLTHTFQPEESHLAGWAREVAIEQITVAINTLARSEKPEGGA
jgi:hypothetical protein